MLDNYVSLNDWIAVITPSVILFPLYFLLANHFNIYDSPIGRSSHTKRTITGSGIVFTVSLFITSIFVEMHVHYFFWIGLVLLVTVSFVDDLIFLKISYRFIVQLIAMALIVSVIPISESNGSFSEKLPIWVGATIFGTFIINGFNFMDGINGLLGSCMMVVLLSLAYLNATLTDAEGHLIRFADPILIYSLIASLAVFLFFNFRFHAKTFMGDAGSVGIAFITTYLIYMLVSKTGNISYLLLISVLGIDSGLTVIYKLILKENIFIPHRDFLFKKLVHIGKYVHVKVALIYASIQAIINAIIIFLPFNKGVYAQISLVFIIISAQIALFICVRNRFTKTRIIDIRTKTKEEDNQST